ncbi:branched-chain amino acid ABC transporter permease [Microvirga pudoricolor]|uniref:branched-chain amino acid ABC transporter permease n=1 Tax=Microvirga pudoricolor TaxID=2778729 RepID=UPI00195267F7|nr:branched-chain amino acid ABC transporter permease [Microvirga pudoricolor]MBM6595307.1 branched-chain amino acid ABC transporter permease [Microvirga pudoricolor]
MVVIFAILTLSLNLISGYGGLISLGHAGFFLIGSYTSALLSVYQGWPFWLSMPTAILLTATSGLLLGFPALRWTGHFLAVITIAFGSIAQLLSVNWVFLTNGIDGVSSIPRPPLPGISLTSNVNYYYFVLICLAFIVYLMMRLVASGFGRALRAIKDDETAAACMGIDVAVTKVSAFVISAAIAGFAGALYAHYIRFLNPDSFSLDVSIRIFMMMIIGGTGSIAGSILGSFVVYVLPEVLRPLQDYYYLIWGVIVILVMLFLPGGLISLGSVLRAKMAARRDKLDPQVGSTETLS